MCVQRMSQCASYNNGRQALPSWRRTECTISLPASTNWSSWARRVFDAPHFPPVLYFIASWGRCSSADTQFAREKKWTAALDYSPRQWQKNASPHRTYSRTTEFPYTIKWKQLWHYGSGQMETDLQELSEIYTVWEKRKWNSQVQFVETLWEEA